MVCARNDATETSRLDSEQSPKNRPLTPGRSCDIRDSGQATSDVRPRDVPGAAGHTFLGDAMEPVSRLAVTDIVSSRILDYIRSQHLRPGDKLPSEKDLIRDLRVSRASIREAIRSLIATGIIELQPGLGTFVAKPNILTLFAHGMLPSLLGTPGDLELFMEARRVVEPEITALAAIRATPSDLEVAEAALQPIVDAVARGCVDCQPQVEFHSALLRASGNWVLVELMLPVIQLASQLVLQIAEVHATASIADFLRHQAELHRDLFEAVCSADPERARAAALQHIDAAYDDAREVLASRRAAGGIEAVRRRQES